MEVRPEQPSESGPQPPRQFGWSDMFVRPEDDPRTDGRFDGERATLSASCATSA
jgi:hypothetical protein